MNNLDINTELKLLTVDSANSLQISPSVSNFLPEEDASIYPLLPPSSTTPSPPPMQFMGQPIGVAGGAFIHPLTPSTTGCNDDDITTELPGDDAGAETSSSGSSSGIAMDIPVAGTTTLFNKNVYQHLGKTSEISQENDAMKYANLNIQITNESPGFVHWNWPLIRKCSFLIFMAGIIAMTAVVIALIVTLPKICNPKNEWYKGSVLYEIFPTSFHDSNNDGFGDLRGIANRVNYLKDLGIGGIRLNAIFPSKNYPDHFDQVTTLFEIDEVLGGTKELANLSESLHKRNISIILDLPIYPLVKQLDIITDYVIDQYVKDVDVGNLNKTIFHTTTITSVNLEEDKNKQISAAMKHWLSYGIDGFYVKGLEHFIDDPYFVENIKYWKHIIGPGKVLMINNLVLEQISDKHVIDTIIHNIDLIDVFIDVTNGTQKIAELINSTINGIIAPTHENSPYIHWSFSGVSDRRISNKLNEINATLSATLMELMLPGTPNIFYGDEISLQEVQDKLGDHSHNKHLHHLSSMAWNTVPQIETRALPWLPKGNATFHHLDIVKNMIQLRDRSPSIYQNVVRKSNALLESNTMIKYSRKDVLIIERRYPRRNTFASISNFGNQKLSLDLSSIFYSGEIVIGTPKNEKIYFSQFTVNPMETIIVKLDK